LVFRQFSELVERAVPDGGWGVFERRRTKVELALLEGHEAGRGKDAMSVMGNRSTTFLHSIVSIVVFRSAQSTLHSPAV